MKIPSLAVLGIVPFTALAQNDDLFNYVATDGRDFGPEEWINVGCDNVSECTGWPDDWLVGQGWSLQENSCRWCPDGASTCGEHHQSPIPLRRQVALEENRKYNVCRDQHWMKYEDGSCTWEQLEDSFTIERHALKVSQPVEFNEALGDGKGFRLDCASPDGPRRFARIDFSWGFNWWWFQSHLDIKIPSEHTQNGKRYSAEVQMAHFFEIKGSAAREENEMATVAVLLEAHEDYPVYPHLDRMICAWRKAEARTRAECGLDPIEIRYPSCFEPRRGGSVRQHRSGDFVREPDSDNTSRNPSRRRQTLQQARHEAAKRGERIRLESYNQRPADQTDEEFAEFIEAESQRNLYENEHLPFHNYQFLIDSRTEYYHRYHGTTTIPPCFGPMPDDSHYDTNHWRIMKDPIRINQRQIDELERLLRERIAPLGSVHKECQPDTAGNTDTGTRSSISVARPMQEEDGEHDTVFCWCPQWPSKWPEDRAWCDLADELGDRYVMLDKPYNYAGSYLD